MKRLFSLAISFFVILLSSCSPAAPQSETGEPVSAPGSTFVSSGETEEFRTVSSPLAERPNYVLPEGAGADEMRETAIRAMRDELTVRWVTPTEITYLKSGSGDGKTFRYTPYETYAGLPYTNGGCSLFQWLEYYDYETGRMIDLPNGEAFNSTLGNSCAASVMWGWGAAVTGTTWRSTETCLPAYGAIRLGPYSYPDDLKSYADLPTARICANNGEQKMYASYACLLPADCLVTAGNGNTGHMMMAIEAAHVEYRNGAIDGDASFVMIQEQRSGIFQTGSDYIVNENGERLHYSGRTNAKITFRELYQSHYLPHTCAEFLGQKDYVLPSAELTAEIKDLGAIKSAAVQSAYRICVVYARIADAAGSVLFTRRSMSVYSDQADGSSWNYPLSRLPVSAAVLSRSLEKGKTYSLTLLALDATGTLHDLASFDFTL